MTTRSEFAYRSHQAWHLANKLATKSTASLASSTGGDAASQLYNDLMAAVGNEAPQSAAQVFAIKLRDWMNRQFNLTPEQRAEMREFVIAMSLFGDKLEEDATLRALKARPNCAGAVCFGILIGVVSTVLAIAVSVGWFFGIGRFA